MLGFYTEADRESLEFYLIRILKGPQCCGLENGLEVELMSCKEAVCGSISDVLVAWTKMVVAKM